MGIGKSMNATDSNRCYVLAIVSLVAFLPLASCMQGVSKREPKTLEPNAIAKPLEESPTHDDVFAAMVTLIAHWHGLKAKPQVKGVPEQIQLAKDTMSRDSSFGADARRYRMYQRFLKVDAANELPLAWRDRPSGLQCCASSPSCKIRMPGPALATLSYGMTLNREYSDLAHNVLDPRLWDHSDVAHPPFLDTHYLRAQCCASGHMDEPDGTCSNPLDDTCPAATHDACRHTSCKKKSCQCWHGALLEDFRFADSVIGTIALRNVLDASVTEERGRWSMNYELCKRGSLQLSIPDAPCDGLMLEDGGSSNVRQDINDSSLSHFDGTKTVAFEGAVFTGIKDAGGCLPERLWYNMEAFADDSPTIFCKGGGGSGGSCGDDFFDCGDVPYFNQWCPTVPAPPTVPPARERSRPAKE